MSEIVGVALEAGVLRAAIRTGDQISTTETVWDGESPESAIELLRTAYASVQGITLSIGLAFLEIAQPELPPLADADVRRVLLRDADRYFPVEGSVAISGPRGSGLAFATSSARLQRWVNAFEEWAPVRAIIAAPFAIAAGVSVVHRAAPGGVRVLMVDAGADEVGLVRLHAGQVVEVRRLPAALKSALPADAEPLSAVYLPGSSGDFAAALGSIAFAVASLDEMLLDANLESAFRARQTRRQWMSVALFASAIVVFGIAVDSRRDAMLRITRRVNDSLVTAAQPGRISQARLLELTREIQILNNRSATSDPLGTVATLSRLLPADAFVERMTWDGAEWRLDGSTDRAASIVPSLDSAPAFKDVRVLTASTRFRDGSRMRESFSVAFKVRGDSIARR